MVADFEKKKKLPFILAKKQKIKVSYLKSSKILWGKFRGCQPKKFERNWPISCEMLSLICILYAGGIKTVTTERREY